MPRCTAVGADARNDQPMARIAEVVLGSHCPAEVREFFALELNQLVAHRAMQMIVLGITVVVLVDSPPPKIHPP